MYTVVVETTFSAIHRVRFADGSVEPVHGHDWVVRAHFAREELDAAGMVVGFEGAMEALGAVAAELHHRDLNAHPCLAGVNPTAENIARHFFDALRARGLETVGAVHVTESPGCVAIFES